MSNLLIKPRIKKSRHNLQLVVDSIGRKDLYVSEHVADRIIERNLTKYIPFIGKISRYFYDELYAKSTYTNRSYKVGFRGLYACFQIRVGAVSGKRQCLLTTAFEGDKDYFCDETIILK